MSLIRGINKIKSVIGSNFMDIATAPKDSPWLKYFSAIQLGYPIMLNYKQLCQTYLRKRINELN